MHFKLILVMDGLGIYCRITLGWLPLDHICHKSTLVQVMAWCHQAASHYLSQCWPRSMSPYGITSPQWVNYMGLTFEGINDAWGFHMTNIIITGSSDVLILTLLCPWRLKPIVLEILLSLHNACGVGVSWSRIKILCNITRQQFYQIAKKSY